MFALLALLVLLAQLASAAELTIFTQTPAMVSVDGKVIDYDEASLVLIARNLKAGKHTVKVATVSGKPVTQLDVDLRQTERVDLVYGQRTLEAVRSGLVGEPSPWGENARVGDPPRGSGSPVIIVNTGGYAPPAPPASVKPPEPPKPEPVQVVFSLKDSFDMSNVYVDGKRVVEFRTGDQEKVVTLMSGLHTVEIKEFTEFDTWFKGTLLVTPGEPLRFGYGEKEGVEVYNRASGAWTPR